MRVDKLGIEGQDTTTWNAYVDILHIISEEEESFSLVKESNLWLLFN